MEKLSLTNLVSLSVDFDENDLTCPVCLVVPRSGALFNCPNGHNVCGPCKEGLPTPPHCPTCRAPAQPWTRNVVIQKVLDKWQFPCRYPGCSAMVARRDLDQHESDCNYKPTLPCADLNCAETLSLPEMVEHIKGRHGGNRTLEMGRDGAAVSANFTVPAHSQSARSGPWNWIGHLISFDGRHFYFTLRKQGGTFKAFVYFIGMEKDCEGYAVTVETAGGIVLKYEGPANPAETFGVASVAEEVVGLTFPQRVAAKAMASGDLTFSVAIRKEPSVSRPASIPRGSSARNRANQRAYGPAALRSPMPVSDASSEHYRALSFFYPNLRE